MDGVVAWFAFAQWLAADESKPPAWDTFAQYSVLGIAVLGFGLLLYRIFMQLWARSGVELAREVARGDRLESENRVLNLAMQDKAIPALMAAGVAITQCTELIRELQRDRDYSRQRRIDRDGEGH